MTWPVADFRRLFATALVLWPVFFHRTCPSNCLCQCKPVCDCTVKARSHLHNALKSVLDFVLGCPKHMECPFTGQAFVGGKGMPLLINEGLYLVQVGLKPILWLRGCGDNRVLVGVDHSHSYFLFQSGPNKLAKSCGQHRLWHWSHRGGAEVLAVELHWWQHWGQYRNYPSILMQCWSISID